MRENVSAVSAKSSSGERKGAKDEHKAAHRGKVLRA